MPKPITTKQVQKQQFPLNAKALADQLWVTVKDLKEGTTKPDVANAMSNAAGKIIAIARLQLEYCKLSGHPVTVGLLESK